MKIVRVFLFGVMCFAPELSMAQTSGSGDQLCPLPPSSMKPSSLGSSGNLRSAQFASQAMSWDELVGPDGRYRVVSALYGEGTDVSTCTSVYANGVLSVEMASSAAAALRKDAGLSVDRFRVHSYRTPAWDYADVSFNESGRFLKADLFRSGGVRSGQITDVRQVGNFPGVPRTTQEAQSIFGRLYAAALQN